MKSYAVLALAMLGAVACAKRDAGAPATEGAPASAAKPADYPLTGEIISVDPARKVIVVKHDAIEGYMPAMTMAFSVSPADLAAAKPGQRIRAHLIPSEDSEFRLEQIWPDDPAARDALAASALVLRQDTHSRGKGVYREVGETMPDFALYDQEGRVFQTARLRGKQVMLNFIYTRCPVATMCPASTAKMMSIQQLALEAGVSNLELVSISLDPAFDTPAVLKDYAAVRGIDTGNFTFLTGSEQAIKDLLAQFGVLAEAEDDYLKHTLSTLLIDESGKIIHRADGSGWETAGFIAKIRKQ